MKKGLTRFVSLSEMKSGSRQGVKTLQRLNKKAEEVATANAQFEAKVAAEVAAGGLGVIS